MKNRRENVANFLNANDWGDLYGHGTGTALPESGWRSETGKHWRVGRIVVETRNNVVIPTDTATGIATACERSNRKSTMPKKKRTRAASRRRGSVANICGTYHFSSASVRMWKIPRDCRGESESL